MRLGELVDSITALFDAGRDGEACDLLQRELWSKYPALPYPDDMRKLKADVTGLIKTAYQRGKDGQLRSIVRHIREESDANASL